ncbi:MAG: transglycosylase SLT domain-containing protein [Bacilli bacterium]|nr:transglycosylase SLT domain-containing protein [Bacilli bacterium]
MKKNNKDFKKYTFYLLCTLLIITLWFMIFVSVAYVNFKKSEVSANSIKENLEKTTIDIQEDEIISISPYPLTNEENEVIIYPGYECRDVVFSDMQYYTPEFKYIPIKINNWVVTKDIQRNLYNTCKKYNVNYIQALAIMYAEGARNNQYCIHYNDNGTQDIGIMQFNTSNIDIIELMTHSTDIEWLKDINTNLKCACYLIWRNENYIDEIECLYDSLVVYNGGVGVLKKIKSGEYSLKQKSSLYAAKVINYMDALYNYYFYESNNKDI